MPGGCTRPASRRRRRLRLPTPGASGKEGGRTAPAVVASWRSHHRYRALLPFLFSLVERTLHFRDVPLKYFHTRCRPG